MKRGYEASAVQAVLKSRRIERQAARGRDSALDCERAAISTQPSFENEWAGAWLRDAWDQVLFRAVTFQ